VLLTGEDALYLERRPHRTGAAATVFPGSPQKVAGRHLGPYLETLRAVS
jgi:hypothetical protein